jgi:hypothetical protein
VTWLRASMAGAGEVEACSGAAAGNGEGGGGARPALRCELASGQLAFDVLRGLSSGKKEQHCVVEVDAQGLRFITTDRSRGLQGVGTLPARSFDVFELQSSDMQAFRISLPVLLNCLGSLGPQLESTTLAMSYFATEETFSLRLTEGAVVTECKIRTLVDVEGDPMEAAAEGGHMPLRSAFKSDPVVNKCMISAAVLREAFSVIDEMPDAAQVKLLLSPDKPFLRMHAAGQLLSCAVDFPRGDESLTNLKCKAPKEASYRLSLMQQACKALSLATRTSIRMNEANLLCLQHMLEGSADKVAYVDFYVVSDTDPEEEEEEEEEEGGVAARQGLREQEHEEAGGQRGRGRAGDGRAKRRRDSSSEEDS